VLHIISTCCRSFIMHCVTNIQGRERSSWNNGAQLHTAFVCMEMTEKNGRKTSALSTLESRPGALGLQSVGVDKDQV
jgi:hypothetical protein